MNVVCNKCFPRWWIVANIIAIILVLGEMLWLVTDIPEPVYVKKIAEVGFWGLLFLSGYSFGMRNRCRPDRLK